MAIGTVRVGIVGVGNNAAPHRGPAYQRLPQVELTVCCATLLASRGWRATTRNRESLR